MTWMLPTVGRVSLFTPSRLTGEGFFAHIDGPKPLAAIISHVFSDKLVKPVFDSNGVSHGRAKPEYGYFCEWMPYQVGPAKVVANSA